MISQMKRPGLAVGRHLPACRGAWHWASVRRIGRQSNQDIADDIHLPTAIDVMRVEALDLDAVATHEIIGRMDGFVDATHSRTGREQQHRGNTGNPSKSHQDGSKVRSREPFTL